MTKEKALETVLDAYKFARNNGPCDETRNKVCKDGTDWDAYIYAKNIDKYFHTVTYAKVAGSSFEKFYIQKFGKTVEEIKNTNRIVYSVIKIKEEENHEGMVWNPISEKWVWGLF